MSKKESSLSFGLGILGGILGGIVAGILYAPKSGQETREEIKETVSELAEKYAPQIQAAKKQAIDSMEMVKYQLEKQYNKFNSSIKAKNLQKAKEKEFHSGKRN